ncbi:MAG: hypothetical protein NC904_08865 [Candidatus Omnitrophica bacterium]|nr:hypothetical protein [Candidatus Omnitrophota bacterium]
MRMVVIFLMGIFVVMGLVSPIYAGRLPLGLDKPADIIPQDSGNMNKVISPNESMRVYALPPGYEKIRTYPAEFISELDKIRSIAKERVTALVNKYKEEFESLDAQMAKISSEEYREIRKVEDFYNSEIASLKQYMEELNGWKEESLKAIFNEFIDELKKAIKERRYGDILEIVKGYFTARKSIIESYNSEKREAENKIKELEEKKILEIKAIREKYEEERRKLDKLWQELYSKIDADYEKIRLEVEDKVKSICKKYGIDYNKDSEIIMYYAMPHNPFHGHLMIM